MPDDKFIKFFQGEVEKIFKPVDEAKEEIKKIFISKKLTIEDVRHVLTAIEEQIKDYEFLAVDKFNSESYVSLLEKIKKDKQKWNDK